MPRIRAVRVIFALLFVPGSSTFPHPPQKSSVVLSGTIFSESTSRRVARANTTLCDNGGTPLQQSAAGDDGEFSFQGISPGRYILKVQAMGFEPAQLPVDLSSTSQRGFSVMLTPVLIAKQPGSAGQTISAHELSMPMASRELLASGKKKLYTDKNGQAALRDFQSAMQKSGNCYEAYYLAGMAYLSLQNPVEAENHFRKSVELSESQYADADIALGMLLLQRHEAHDGEAFLRKGLGLDPRSWPGQFALGEMELTRGNEEPALAAAHQAASLAPNQPVVYRLLALIHLRQKNYPALLTDLDAYIKLDPDSAAGVRAKELRAQTEKQILNSPATEVSANK